MLLLADGRLGGGAGGGGGDNQEFFHIIFQIGDACVSVRITNSSRTSGANEQKELIRATLRLTLPNQTEELRHKSRPRMRCHALSVAVGVTE